MLLVVQLLGSRPDPLSVQFQVTVTSLLFQPAVFAGGARVAFAVGGVVS
jgi:hypothetical protein